MKNEKSRLEKDDIRVLEDLIEQYHVCNPDQSGFLVNILLKQSRKIYTLDEVAYMYMYVEKFIRRKKSKDGKCETTDQ